jgi:hypothetical protein
MEKQTKYSHKVGANLIEIEVSNRYVTLTVFEKVVTGLNPEIVINVKSDSLTHLSQFLGSITTSVEKALLDYSDAYAK